MHENRRRIGQLLALSWLTAVGRAVVAPLLVLTLGRRLGLASAEIGLLLGAVLLSATLSSLYLGYLVDRFNRRRLMSLALSLVAVGFALIPVSSGVGMAACGLLLVEGAFSLFGIAAKAALSDLSPPASRGRLFSLRYTLVNIGFAIGPFIGSLLMEKDPAWPFWLASALLLSGLPLLRGLPGRAAAAGARPAGFAATLRVLVRDRVLLLFILGSLLAYMVHGRFADYLSMYLLKTHDDATVLRWMSALILTNALVVVTLQYPLGRWMRQRHLLRWIALSSLLLAASMLGFAHSGTLFAWCAWMAVFTLGEVIIIPAEYLYVDALAPEALKGSYYGAHSLAFVGSAANPVLSGLMLAALPAPALLWTLAGACLLGLALVRRAERLRRGEEGCRAAPDAVAG